MPGGCIEGADAVKIQIFDECRAQTVQRNGPGGGRRLPVRQSDTRRSVRACSSLKSNEHSSSAARLASVAELEAEGGPLLPAVHTSWP